MHTNIIKTPQSGRGFTTRPCRTSNQLKACRGAGQTSADTVWREHDMNQETLICQVVWCRESFIGLKLSPCPPTFLSVTSISSKLGIPLIASITIPLEPIFSSPMSMFHRGPNRMPVSSETYMLCLIPTQCPQQPQSRRSHSAQCEYCAIFTHSVRNLRQPT